MEQQIKLSDNAEKKLAELQVWIEAQKKGNSLANIQFCPYDLRAGEAEDYVEDAYNMLLDYNRGNYTDITNLIL